MPANKPKRTDMKYALGGNAWQGRRRPRALVALGAGVLVLISIGIFVLIIRGNTRIKREQQPVDAPIVETNTTTQMVARHLDGVMVPRGLEALPVFAVMIENHTDARPLSGPSKANIVFEYPVEGGITRLFGLFDASSTVGEIGPIRSARPYYVDTARAWNAAYFHVGGSPQALDQIKAFGASFLDVDEFRFGPYFWRSKRPAPHNVYSSTENMLKVVTDKGFASSTSPIAWHFQDMATTTERGDDGQKVSLPYGGNYNAIWTYDKQGGIYKRYQAGRLQKDADGSEVVAENVIIMSASTTVIDAVGRLQIKTTGGGDAIGYRDGKQFNLRWRRAAGEPYRFEGLDGTEFIFNRGRTWVEVTDPQIFGNVTK